MATPAGVDPPPLPTLERLTEFDYTKLVTDIIPIKNLIERVEDDYKKRDGTLAKANYLATVSSGIRLHIEPIDIDVQIIQPMKSVYEEYKRKMTFMKRLQSLSAELTSDRSLVPDDIDNVIAKLDDTGDTGPKYNPVDDDDTILDNVPRDKRDGRHTMLNVYRLYIYGYFFLYEIHRLYIHFGVYIKDVYLRVVRDVLDYVRSRGVQVNNFEVRLRELEQHVAAARVEALQLQQEIDRLRLERPTTPEEIAALNQAIADKRTELERINAALAAAMESSAAYSLRTKNLREYLNILSGITFENLNDTVDDKIVRRLRNQELVGGAPASQDLTVFINAASKRIQDRMESELIVPAKRFLDECLAVFTDRIQQYNQFKGHIQRFYEALQTALAALQERDGLNLEGKRAQLAAVQEERRRADEKQRLERERDNLDDQIRRARSNRDSAPVMQAALEMKMKGLKARFERLEADLSTTRLSTSIENAKTRAELVGVR